MKEEMFNMAQKEMLV